MWTAPTWWSGFGLAGNAVPLNLSSTYPSTGTVPFLTSGVVIADGQLGASSLIVKTGLFTLVPTLDGWLVTGPIRGPGLRPSRVSARRART